MALLLFLAAAPADARKLYKFVDENGIVHYTDRPPATNRPIEAWSVRVDPQPMVRLRQERRGEGVRIIADNRWHGPVQLLLFLSRRLNVRTEPALPADLVLHGFGEAPILTIAPASPGPSEFQLRTHAVPGDPDAEPVPYVYPPPFAPNERYFISQAFDGGATHQTPESRFAVDLAMPEGTPVLAARPGMVMHVEADFFGSGLDPARYGQRANHVRVLHDDGTMALYAHLALERVFVRPGARVALGDQLGLSGNTGLSTGPHLHFAVQRNVGGRLVSIPFAFDDGSAGGAEPVAGRWLRHPPVADPAGTGLRPDRR